MIHLASILPDHAGQVAAFDLALALLDFWGTRPGGGGHLDLDDDAFQIWAALVETVELHFDESDGTIDARDLAWIESTQTESLEDHSWARAIAWGLDVATWHAFPAQWRAQLGGTPTHRLREGEVYPVADWLPDPPVGLTRSVRPSAETTRDDELPHIRRWTSHTSPGSEPVEVEFHFDASPDVRAAAEAAAAATIHANGADSEFILTGTASIFPVFPSVEDQGARIVSLLSASATRHAGLAVGGEVSLTDDALAQVQDWLDSTWTAPALIVPGSLHTYFGTEPANLAFALRRRRARLEHRKVVPFEKSTSPKRAPVREGIVPGPRVLKVWDGGWARFAMLICRDVLDPGMRGAVSRAGVNLLAIPTFSEETSSFSIHVGSLSLATQGRVALANNPARFRGEVVAPAAVFGQPLRYLSSTAMAVPHGSSGRGLALDRLGETPEWIEKT